MSNESIVGGRRNVGERDEFDVIGPKRSAKKLKRDKVRALELDIAAPRKAKRRGKLPQEAAATSNADKGVGRRRRAGPATMPEERVKERVDTEIRLEKSPIEPKADMKLAKKRRVKSKKPSGSWIFFLVAALLLIGLTLGVFLSQERYQHNGQLLLAEPLLSEGLEGWTTNGQVTFNGTTDGGVALENDDLESRTYLRRDVDLPPGLTLVNLEATVSTEDVVSGEEIWQSARIYLVQRDQEGQALWKEPHNLFTFKGTRDGVRVQKVFPIPPSIDNATLSLELSNATGWMMVSDLKVYPVEERAAFQKMAMGLMVVWGALAITAAFMLVGSITSIWVKMGLGVTFGVLVAGLFMPAPMRNALIEPLQTSYGTALGIEPDMIGHCVVFTVMAFLVRLGRLGDSFVLHFFCWIVLASATEVLQLFTFDREPTVLDFLVDALGIVIGLTLAQIFKPFRSRSTAQA